MDALGFETGADVAVVDYLGRARWSAEGNPAFTKEVAFNALVAGAG